MENQPVALSSFRKTFVRQNHPVHVRRRTLLRFIDFRRLVFGQFVSQSSDAVTSLFVAKFVLFDSNDGPTTTRLIQTVLTASIPLFLAGPLSGAIADKFSRRTILWCGQVLRALLVAGLYGCSQYGSREAVFVLFACCMCLTRVLYTTRVATIRHLVRQHELVAADSLLLTLSNVAGALGGLLGVLALRYVQQHGLIFVVIGHLVAARAFFRIITVLGGGHDHVPTSWKSAISNLCSLKTRYAIASTSTHRLLYGIAFSAAALHLDSDGPGSYAMLLGASGAGSFLGNNTAEWTNEHLPRRSIAILTHLGSAIAVCCCLLRPTTFVIVPAIVAVAFLFQNLRVCSDATVQKNATQGAGGRVFAAYDLMSNILFLAGLLIGLSFMPVAGIHIVLASLTGAFAISSAVFGSMNRKDADTNIIPSVPEMNSATEIIGLI